MVEIGTIFSSHACAVEESASVHVVSSVYQLGVFPHRLLYSRDVAAPGLLQQEDKGLVVHQRGGGARELAPRPAANLDHSSRCQLTSQAKKPWRVYGDHSVIDSLLVVAPAL